MANGPANTTTNNNSGGLIVNFSGTPGTVSQSSAMQVNQVNFLVNGYTWTASGARSLTFTNGINLADGVNTTITTTSGNSFTFTGTGVSGGTGSSLTLGLGASSGSSVYTSAIYFSGGTISVPINMNVGGASNGFAAKFFLGTQSSANGGVTISGNITNNSAGPLDLTNAASGNLVINGVISGSRGITLGNSSSGNIVLNSANTYSGGTVLLSTSSGEIRYSNSTTFGSGAITSSGNGTTNYIRALANNLDLANSITIDANNTLRVGATNTGWKANYSGEISGAGSVLYSLSGFMALSGTNSSFGGGFVLGSSGRADLSKIGLAGQNSSIGTNGVITAGLITTPSSQPTMRWVGTTNDTSDKVINIANATGGLTLETIGNGDLTLNGNINSSGLGGPKMINLNPYTNATTGTTNTLSLNGVINDGTPGYVVNDTSVSSGSVVTTNVVGGVTNRTTNYFGSSTITLASVAGVTIGASISGGGCIANGTTITAVDTGTKTITLSQNTTNTNNISAGLAVMNVSGATAATSLTIRPISSAGSTFVNVVLGNTNNSFSGPVIFTNSQSGLVSILKIGKFGNPGENSSLGSSGNFTFGGASGSTCTLEYTGSGEVSTKNITLGGTSGGIALSQSGTGLLKLAGTISPGTTTAARTLTLTGSSAGSGELAGNLSDPNGFALSVSKSGTNTWTLSGTNTYSGNTTIVGSGTGATNSVLRVVGANALSPNTVLVGASGSSTTATLDLSVAGNYVVNAYGSSANNANNINFTASSGSATTLTFTNATNVVTASTSAGRSIMNNSANLTMDFLGAIDFSSSTTNDLTIGGAGNVRVRGPIFNTSTGVRSVTRGAGAGTLFLNGTNTYNGVTTISDGNLAMANPKAIPAGSAVVLSGGTLRVDYVDGNSDTLGNLSVTGNSFIDLGVGTSGSTLKFASGTNWTSSRTLTVANSSTGAKLYITNTANVATNQIKSAENPNATASLASDGLLSFSSGIAAPSGLSYANIDGTVGTDIGNVNPTVTGGTPTGYSISPALPAGLLFNMTTGVISGTPSVAATSATYTVTATNEGGSTTGTVTVAVIPAAPSGPTIEEAYPGKDPLAVNPNNGLTYLLNYAFGGSDTTAARLPVMDTSDPTKLTLVAYVRTAGDIKSVVGETASTLTSFDSLNTIPGEVINPSDAPTGMEKRMYSVMVSGDRKFLRLKVTKR